MKTLFLAGMVVLVLPPAAASEFYVDASRGDDAAAGTIERPWRTLGSSVPRLEPGDTLYLREGVFFEKEISIAVRGTSGQPITIRNHPGESPVIDGAFREFREPGNDDWELVDPEIGLYASKKTYPDPEILHGYFEFRNTLYKLVGYDDYADLTSRSQYASPDIPFYVGQGAHWRESDGRIYIRMQQSDIANANGYNPPGFLTDPRKLKIILFGNGTVLRAEKESGHIRLEGLTVQGQEHVLEFAAGASHVVIRDCRLLGGRFHVFLGRDVHDLLFDGVTIDGAAPDWIAWLDVKTGRRPARHIESPGIKTSAGVHNLEVRNSTFRRLFDGINANNGGHNFHIHNNLFEHIRDDCLQLGTHAHDIEFAYNRMIGVSKGPGFQGRGDSPRPGTKYFHHNIIDCSKLWLFARRNADGSIAKPDRVKYINDRGEVWARPVGFHGQRGVNDPWKIYHNTIIFGQELNGTGVGLEYPHGSSFDPAVPQEVYNNIIVQVADYWLSSGARVADGSQIFDGNLYFRVPAEATHPFLRDWSGAGGSRDFDSLEEFKASSLFAESKRFYASGFENSGIVADPRLDDDYRPALHGPAASGAVPLPKDWPGNHGERFRGALAPAGVFAVGPASGPGARSEYYVDAARGDDAAEGTIDRPWQTLHASIPRLKPGNTLYLREGVFFEKEIPIVVRGTRDSPITIRNYPGESPVIDGAFREFREPGNDDWELVDAGLQLYASRKSYPYPVILHGYFHYRDTHYKLVGYDNYDDLITRNQFVGADIPLYVGPGAHWRQSDGRLYIRLEQSEIAKENGYALPGLPTDPRELSILLFGNGNVLLAGREAAHINLEGLTVQGQEHVLQFAFGGASHFKIRNCRFLGGRFHIYLGPYTHDILFDGISIDGGAPDWIAWLDVKVGRRPAQHLESPGIRITQYVRNVEVRNSVFRRLFDGVNSNDGGSNMIIHHNLFEYIRDDVLQLGTHTHDVEFAYNRIIGASKGPAFQGRGNSARPGTKYFHHNIIDCNKLWLFARRHADGSIAKPDRVKYINDRGEVWARPVGSHGGNRGVDPWKIYHNTIIFGQELNGTGNGLEYMHGAFFDPAVPQEVYNNIIVQVADYWLSSGARVADGSQIFDGNLYHRVPRNATHPFLRQWAGANESRDFQSLEEFKASPLFSESRRIYRPGFENSGIAADPRLDRDFRPAEGGPAATGAVPLPAHWPGNHGEKFRGALAPAKQ